MASKMPEFATGGAGWIMDLSAQDPYLVLPIANAAIFLATLEAGAMEGIQDNPQFAGSQNLFRMLGFGMVPLTYTFPAGVFVYWVTSSTWTLGQVQLPQDRSPWGLESRHLES
jgi:YidC/Oxa1 family membrane protein insertase